jgi:hypothetical protein
MLKRSFIVLFLIALSVPVLAKFTSPFKGGISPSKVRGDAGSVVTLVLTIEAIERFKDVDIHIKLPKGIELVKGESLIQIADFGPHDKKRFSYKVRIKEKGEQRIIIGAKVKGFGADVGMGTTFVSIINSDPGKDKGTHTVDSDGVRVFVK